MARRITFAYGEDSPLGESKQCRHPRPWQGSGPTRAKSEPSTDLRMRPLILPYVPCHSGIPKPCIDRPRGGLGIPNEFTA
eukprot:7864334-Pyramimonas_sp.AAC.1